MDLTLLQSDLQNNVLLLADGTPLYLIDTPFKFFGRTTTIKRIDGQTQVDVASFQPASWSSQGIVRMRDSVIALHKHHAFTTSEVFNASDGRSYKWKSNTGDLLLVTDDGSRTPVAIFVGANLGIFSPYRPACLSITPQGMPILDELVATFIFILQKKRHRESRERRRRRQR